MLDHDALATQFEANRTHLRSVAYRMLGSLTEAEDAVQDAWLRLSRSDAGEIANLGGWLTTVTARVCLDMLRARESRREESLDAHDALPATRASAADAEQETILAESVGLALLVVLEMLTPAERLAFVLHDTFAVPFEEIAPIVGRSIEATRQLASRARRRVRGAPAVPEADLTRQREVVDAYLAASRSGDFDALVALLDPDVVLRADAGAVKFGATAEMRGAEAVATSALRYRARFATPALVRGSAGLIVAPRGRLRMALALTVRDGRIEAIEVIGDASRLQGLELGAFEA